MEEIKKGIVNENEKAEMRGPAAKSAFLTEIKPLIQDLVAIAERYVNPAEGEKKNVAIAVIAIDNDADVNTSALCGTSKNLILGLYNFAKSNRTAGAIYMTAAALATESITIDMNIGKIAKA